VVGGRDMMQVLAEGEVFVSSTYYPNSLEMVASLACIDILEREKVCDSIWERGTKFGQELARIVEASGAYAQASGIPPMPYVTFPPDPHKKYKERRKLFFAQAVRRGLFMQPYHHSYIMHRHTDADLKDALRIIEESLAEVAKAI